MNRIIRMKTQILVILSILFILLFLCLRPGGPTSTPRHPSARQGTRALGEKPHELTPEAGGPLAPLTLGGTGEPSPDEIAASWAVGSASTPSVQAGQVIPGVRVGTSEICGQALVSWAQLVVLDRQLGPRAQPDRAEEIEHDAAADVVSESADSNAPESGPGACPTGNQGTPPSLGINFQTIDRTAALWDPPDTMGAAGPRHFVEVINGRVAVFDKSSGLSLGSVSSYAFFHGFLAEVPYFDPRVLFDPHSGRWIIAATSCAFCSTSKLVFAVSTSDDPTGDWFQFCLRTGAGWADFPILGADHDGIYLTAGVSGPGARLWAIEKAPLLAPEPRLGTITRFNSPQPGFLWRPSLSYEPGGPYYLIHLEVPPAPATPLIRFFELRKPLTNPVLSVLGAVSIPAESTVTCCFALGAGCPFPVGAGIGLGNVVHRNGSLWTCRVPRTSGRFGCRWYQFSVSSQGAALVQCGTVSDGVRDYYFPSLAVNSSGDMVMAFSGSNFNEWIGAYFAGRLGTDPPGHMSIPMRIKGGDAPYCPKTSGTIIRWGDYSHTSLDPTDDDAFWTIQEYGGANSLPDNWGTWVGRVSFAGFDCNSNGVPDADDIAAGTSVDCLPNGVPDECEPDCNGNGVADACDIRQGTSADCDITGTPDECEPFGPDCDADGIRDYCAILDGARPDCNRNRIPDGCDLASATSPDCNSSAIPDECEAGGNEDCNANGTADLCDIAAATSGDCDANAVPDECQSPADCNANGAPDFCDIASGLSRDCNANAFPDECETGVTPAARIIGATSFETPSGTRGLAVHVDGRVENQDVTSEPRSSGLNHLRIRFDRPLAAIGEDPVQLFEQAAEPGCPTGTQAAYAPSAQSIITAHTGSELSVTWSAGLTNARTYKFLLGECVSSIPGQWIEVRALAGDASSDGRVNGADRSRVIGVWTGPLPRYTPETDIIPNGVTDGLDRSEVIGRWTSPENCAP